MLSLILIITLPLYYIFKGIIVKETKALTIITLIVFLSNLCIIYFMSSSWIKIFLSVYLIYSFADYLCLMYLKRVIYNFPWMSRVRVISEEAIISYILFRPVILIPVNVFLFLKKYPRISLNEEIGVDIKTKDGTQIKINL